MAGMNGHSINGHANGEAPCKGGEGGLSNPKPTRVRRHLQTLEKMLDNGTLAASELPDTIQFAINVRKGEYGDATVREQLRAAELLVKIAEKGVDVAGMLDKIERLDSGQNTEQVGVNIQSKLKRLHDPASLAALETLADRTTEFTDE